MFTLETIVLLAMGLYIGGPTNIDKNTRIGDGCKIYRSFLGSDVKIKNSCSIEDSIIASGAEIGEGCKLVGKKDDGGVIEAVGQSGQKILTGRKNMGAVLGASSIIGDNCLAKPGTLLKNGFQVGDNNILE